MAATQIPSGKHPSAAAQAFDAIAERFDERFTPWLSVTAQRRAVRGALESAFPPGARLIEIGGGTGEDALWLLQRGRQVLLTDPSPLMVRIAAAKFGDLALLVIFGRVCPGEWLVETLRGRSRNAFRRIAVGDQPARLGGREFTVRYHRRRDLERVMTPWFRPAGRLGVGVFVPPSAAEPWISRHPGMLHALETLDRGLAGALAPFGDHILYRFVRTEAQA